MSMSDRIKERRIAMHMTQDELGEKIGVKKSAVAKYENGRVENIKRSVIGKLAEVLECSPSYLLDFEPEYRVSDLKPLEKLDENDAALINAYHSASEETQAIIRRILEI